jgi:hypothetical protein
MHYASSLIPYIYTLRGFELGFMACLLVQSSIHQIHEGITSTNKVQFCTGFSRTLPKQERQ